MKLHVVYRSTGGENMKARPRFYSKLLALCSFLRAHEECEAAVDVVFLNDGPIPADRFDLMAAYGRTIDVADVPLGPAGRFLEHSVGGGLGRSYLAELNLVDEEGWDDGDLVYFVEDDYLHMPTALEDVADAGESLPQAAYLSPFATIDWRMSVPFQRPRITWYVAYSATLTYAARIGALRADRRLHLLSFFAGGTPDRDAFVALRGERPFRWNWLIGDLAGRGPGPSGSRRGRIKRAALQTAVNGLAIKRGFARHLLLGPWPPIALHLEDDVMSVVYPEPWELLARDTREWASARGVTVAAPAAEAEAPRAART